MAGAGHPLVAHGMGPGAVVGLGGLFGRGLGGVQRRSGMICGPGPGRGQGAEADGDDACHKSEFHPACKCVAEFCHRLTVLVPQLGVDAYDWHGFWGLCV